MNEGLLIKFIKFCVVGGSGVLVDFGITYLCKEILRLNKYISNSLGFVCAATSNYILNRLWTFSSQNPDIVGQYARFIAISVVGLALNNCIIWLLNDKTKTNFNGLLGKWKQTDTSKVARINFYCSKLCAIGVVTIWNFLMNYFFTF